MVAMFPSDVGHIRIGPAEQLKLLIVVLVAIKSQLLNQFNDEGALCSEGKIASTANAPCALGVSLGNSWVVNLEGVNDMRIMLGEKEYKMNRRSI